MVIADLLGGTGQAAQTPVLHFSGDGEQANTADLLAMATGVSQIFEKKLRCFKIASDRAEYKIKECTLRFQEQQVGVMLLYFFVFSVLGTTVL